MNILYISHLNYNVSAGLNYSVPAGVNAQSRFDNVYWLDFSPKVMDHWREVPAYHNVCEYSKISLDLLPKPFNKPDLVVFEGFYFIYDPLLARSLVKRKIPYIIIPRSSFTKAAMNNHSWLKKKIAHFLLFDKFIAHAAFIQYLTNQEYRDSSTKYPVSHFILPNGIRKQKNVKQDFLKEGIKAIVIGRYDTYQKGLDVLINAIASIQDELREKKFTLHLYGPKEYNYIEIQNLISTLNISDLIIQHLQVSGRAKEEVLLQSDLYIMTSRFEGHPMGLIEALSYGLPALVTPGSNMSEEIVQYEAGWKCDFTEKSIANSLLEISTHTNDFATFSKHAIVLSNNYDWDNIAKSFHDFISNNL